MKGYKEECSLLVKVTTDRAVTDDVPCKVYPPRRGNKPVYVDLYLTTSQFKSILGAFECSIIGEESGNYFGSRKVSAKTLLRKSTRDVVRGEDIREHVIRFEAWDLRVTSFWHNMKAPLRGENKCRFHLIPSIHTLQTSSVLSPHHTGEVKVEDSSLLTITLNNGVDVFFKSHYTWEYGKSELTLFRELVAECTVNETGAFPTGIEQTLTQIKDILLLASFASREWCFCYKWQADHAEGSTIEYIKTSVPQKFKNSNYVDALILLDHGNTVKTSYNSFANNPYKKYIARAIHYLLPNKHLSVDVRFVQLFMAVEVLAKKCLSGGSVKKHLRELVEDFCKHYNVVLGDLWQMFGGKGSLYSIRNKLAHGEIINSEDYPPVITAQQHLHWSVERMIVGVLGWDIATTMVDPTSMSKAELKDGEWKVAQTMLSK